MALRLKSFVALLITTASVQAQRPESDTLVVQPRDSVLRLSAGFIIPQSDSVFLEGTTLLSRGLHYSMDHRRGVVFLLPPAKALFSRDSSSRVVVRYARIPVRFDDEYFLKEITPTADSARLTIRPVERPARPFSLDDMFSPGLQKSGSLSRGFTIGSNRDLTLQSGFRMQLAGTVSQDVDVVAVLTDENTPLQPEGTTQTLQEVDKVFVEFNHPSWSATLGDFNETLGRSEGGEFGRLSRKLQGARGTVLSRGLFGDQNAGSLSLLGGGGRGKFTTNEFRGQEGRQGPYRLSGSGAERQIVVIAGSERVFLDGVQMARGETGDYTIDYATAEIIFTNRRLITSASRVVVDFEYSDRHYDRNVVGSRVAGTFLKDRIRVNALFYQEGDDPDGAVERRLDEADRAILGKSGSDPLKASTSGFQFVGRDSVTGAALGHYVARDTVINGMTYTIADYAPGDSLALYSVTFSQVESMPPDSAGYDRIGIGQFRFAGIGRGSYLPLRLIPLPVRHRFANAHAEVRLLDDLFVQGEFAASSFDRNRLSSLDDRESPGEAGLFSIRFTPRKVSVGGVPLGDMEVFYGERLQGSRFVPPDRVNEVEFGRKWNLAGVVTGDERKREAGVSFSPGGIVNFAAEYGFLSRGASFRSRRMGGSLATTDTAAYRGEYRAENIVSNNERPGERSSWLRHGGILAIPWGIVTPSLRFETEDRSTRLLDSDSLSGGSFRFVQWSPGLSTGEIFGMRGSAELELREEDSTLSGRLSSAFSAFTQRYSWHFREGSALTTSLSVAARKTRFYSAFRLRGNSNSDVVMVRSLTRYSPGHRGVDADVFYEFSNQRSARLERVYVRVPKGEGNYRYRGDVNQNAIADDAEFEPTRFEGDYIVLFLPGETLYPVGDVKASTRLRFRPGRLLDASSTLGTLLSAVSTETFFRIDERSSNPVTNDLLFLRLSTFLDREHTITGAQVFTQDVHINEHQPGFSSRIRFSQRKGLVQLLSAAERSYSREQSLRIRADLIQEVTNESEVIRRTDVLLSSTPGPRDRSLSGILVSSDITYRPQREWEIGVRITVESVRDRLNGDQATADMNEQRLRAVYAFTGKGQWRAEVTREEAVLSRPSIDPTRIYPYEFTGGKAFGKSYLWSMNLDYRLTGNIQLTVQYGGRTEAKRAPVHTARAEARAFF